MPIDPAQLLKQLEPAVRPVGAVGAARRRLPLDRQSFDSMLSLVSDGTVGTGRAVRLGFVPAEPFDDDQMRRLASAADVAEAAGVASALLLMDGRGVVLEVPGRTLTDELNARSDSALVRLDAAVHVEGPADDDLPLRPDAAPPGVRSIPAGVTRQIAAGPTLAQPFDAGPDRVGSED